MAAKALEAPIKSIGRAEALQKVFGKFHNDLRIWGMSLEDWASRLNVAAAVYAPAFLFSVYPERVHTWETNGRNVLLWFTTLGIARLVKDKKLGLNPLLNRFMVPKTQDPKSLSWAGRLMNPFRPDFNYEEVLEAAKIKKSHWAELEKNELDTLMNKFQGSKAEIERLKSLPASALSKTEQAILKLRHVPRLMNRITSFKLAATALQAALTVYIIGVLAMEVVFRFIAPRDPDFDDSKFKQLKALKAMKKNRNKGLSNAMPSIHQPTTFQSLYQAAGRHPGGFI